MPQRTTTRASMPGFIADPASIRRVPGGRQVYWPGVGQQYQRTPGQVVTAGATAQGATALVVTALTAALPAGSVLDFGADELAVTTADAAAGAVSVPVRALASALEGGEVAVVAGSGGKFIPAGTPMMEITNGSAATGLGMLVPRGLGTLPANRATVGLLTSNAEEDGGIGRTDALSGYGVLSGGTVFETMLPANSLDATVRGELKALDGGGFAFETYADDRPL